MNSEKQQTVLLSLSLNDFRLPQTSALVQLECKSLSESLLWRQSRSLDVFCTISKELKMIFITRIQVKVNVGVHSFFPPNKTQQD